MRWLPRYQKEEPTVRYKEKFLIFPRRYKWWDRNVWEWRWLEKAGIQKYWVRIGYRPPFHGYWTEWEWVK